MCLDTKYTFFPGQLRKHYKKRGEKKKGSVGDRYFPCP